MKKIMLLSLFNFFHLQSQSLSEQLHHCLTSVYKIPLEFQINIIAKCDPLFDDTAGQTILHEFITKSQEIILQSEAKTINEKLYDAVICAPEFHQILFENDSIRILWGNSKPNQQEPMHQHYWKRFMIIMSGAFFSIEYFDGTQEEGYWPIGFYELPADQQTALYTNIGDSEFQALIIEFKE